MDPEYSFHKHSGDNAGDVQTHTATIRYFDVTIPSDVADTDVDEYIIRVNGRVVKRCNPWAAARLGLIEKH
jgi:hypothetical protein